MSDRVDRVIAKVRAIHAAVSPFLTDKHETCGQAARLILTRMSGREGRSYTSRYRPLGRHHFLSWPLFQVFHCEVV